MDRHLLTEAPYYLRALLDLPMPTEAGRSYLPILNTPLKRQIQAVNFPMSADQMECVAELRKLANRGRLKKFTADDLLSLWPAAPGPHLLRSHWDRIAATLEDEGYVTGHWPNVKGGQPASYSIIQPESTTDDQCS
jgi:hypothetical protein